MSTAIEYRQPASHSTLRRLVTRRPVTAFLVMAFGFGWGSAGVAAHSGRR